jgi:hypothetical protein
MFNIHPVLHAAACLLRYGLIIIVIGVFSDFSCAVKVFKNELLIIVNFVTNAEIYTSPFKTCVIHLCYIIKSFLFQTPPHENSSVVHFIVCLNFI